MTNSIELIQNSDFLQDAESWYMQNAVLTATDCGKNKVTISGSTDQDDISALSITIPDIPTDKKLQLSFDYICHDGSQLVPIKIYSFSHNGAVVDAYLTQAMAQQNKWNSFQTTFYATSEAKELTIWIQNPGENAISIARPSLRSVRAHFTVHNFEDHFAPETNAATIIEINYSIEVEPHNDSTTGKVTCPIPGLYQNQFPISFELFTLPAGALQSYRLSQRPDKSNWICEVDLRLSGFTTIKWQATVIVREPENRWILPSPPTPPQNLAQWLKSTACVQADDPAIRDKSVELATNASDLVTAVRQVVEFVHSNRGSEGKIYNSLDAKCGLETGGCCTNAANLMAALLRAQGIPARTISHIPTWGRWMGMHWLTEYWHPDAGWVMLEPSINLIAPSQSSMAMLSIAGADDENKSLDPDFLRTVMPGAPYLSVELISADLEPGWAKASNFAIELGKVKGTQEECENLFREAAQGFENIVALDPKASALIRLPEQAINAIGTGSAKNLQKALFARNQ